MDRPLDISSYRHLWDGSESDWVLFRVGSPRGTVLVPYNISTQEILEIEDDEIAHHVALRMKLSGVPVWTKERERE